MDQITTIEENKRRARAAFHAGRSLDGDGPNWHSAAYPVWKQVYEQLAAANAQQQAVEQAQ